MSTQTIGALIAGLVLICLGGYYISTLSSESSVSDTSQEKTFVISISDKKIVGEDSVFSVNQGDKVIFKITADEIEEFHVHGYDVSTELEPGVEAELAFTADASGNFPFELETSKTDIGALEVLP